MREISQLRFDILAGYVRDHRFFLSIQECEWYESQDGRLLGLVIYDITDNDFAFVILGRDRKNRFRAHKMQDGFLRRKHARTALRVEIAKCSRLPSSVFYQGDEVGDAVDFFRPVVEPNKQSKAFSVLSTRGTFPASRVIEEMLYWYEDVDGNFLEQFQSTGFDARLWELYIYATLLEAGVAFDRSYYAPDFVCNSLYGRFCAEATTVNPSDPPVDFASMTQAEYFSDYIPMKFGSALFSKLKKRYWELEHARGLPLIFAIQDFHELHSMAWSSYALSEYLFGARNISWRDESGNVMHGLKRIDEYRLGEKVVPAGFFFQNDSENISAVISNPGGTLAKFNRLGYLAGIHGEIANMVRFGTCFRSTNQEEFFTANVISPDYVETWMEGLTVFHNPNAKYPLNPKIFPAAAHYYFEGDRVSATFPAFHPTGSIMHTFLKRDSQNILEQYGQPSEAILKRLNPEFKPS